MKARKKPIVLDVWQVKLNEYEPEWIDRPKWINSQVNNRKITIQTPALHDDSKDYLIIHTLEGNMVAEQGDYIVKGIEGEIWPVHKDIFEKNYEVVE